MIIKARSISHIKESLNYILKQEKNHVFLASDGLDTTNVKSMLSDFTLYNKSKVKNGFVSVVISPNKLDRLNHEGYRKVLDSTLKHLKLDNRQFVSVMHTNTRNPHIHVILNRINYNEETWLDKHIAWQCQAACTAVAKELDLHDAYFKVGEAQETINNDYDIERNNTKKLIQAKVKTALFSSTTLEELFGSLLKNGIAVDVVRLKNGRYGTTLNYNGSKFKASSINRKLSLIPAGDGYGPNGKLKEIFERNIQIQTGMMSVDDVYLSLSEDPKRQSRFIEEIIEQQSLLGGLNGLLNDPLDENDGEIEYLKKRKKNQRKKPTIGRSKRKEM